VSELNAVLKMTFKGIDNAQAFNLYLEKAKKIFDCVKAVGSIKIESFGSSALFHYVLKDFNYSVSDAVFERFFKIEKPSNFRSVSFILNEKIDDIQVKNMVDSYEMRQKHVKIEAKGIVPGEEKKVYIKFAPAEMEVTERGLLNRVEIVTDDIKKDDPKGADTLFDKVLNWPMDYLAGSAEKFIFGGK